MSSPPIISQKHPLTAFDEVKAHLNWHLFDPALPGLQELPEGGLFLGGCGQVAAVLRSPPLNGLDQEHSCSTSMRHH